MSNDAFSYFVRWKLPTESFGSLKSSNGYFWAHRQETSYHCTAQVLGSRWHVLISRDSGLSETCSDSMFGLKVIWHSEQDLGKRPNLLWRRTGSSFYASSFKPPFVWTYLSLVWVSYTPPAAWEKHCDEWHWAPTTTWLDMPYCGRPRKPRPLIPFHNHSRGSFIQRVSH